VLAEHPLAGKRIDLKQIDQQIMVLR